MPQHTRAFSLPLIAFDETGVKRRGATSQCLSRKGQAQPNNHFGQVWIPAEEPLAQSAPPTAKATVQPLGKACLMSQGHFSGLTGFMILF